MREKQLLDYLKGTCASRKNRASGSELRQALHISHSGLHKLVNRLRQKGVPIASDRKGYFYAQTAGEVYATIRQLRKMITGLEKAVGGLESALDFFQEGE